MDWVDFKAVKAAVPMQMVLDHYGLTQGLKRNKEELRGRCPIHNGEGKDTFHANTKKNAFQCFSCGARGNVLDLVAAIEECSVRDAGLKLQEWFRLSGVSSAASDGRKVTTTLKTELAPKEEPESEPAGESSEKNKPLGFELKGIDHHHPYLATRGISAELTRTFGIGFFSGKGSMHDRIVIPIHNERGELVAYAGRSIDGTEPKYKLPSGFHKSLELFNLHRAIRAGERRTVVVVEGFFDCMKVHQAGYPCVALIGSQLSEQQEVLLCKSFSGAALLFDGDEAGRRATDECLVRLGCKLWVKAITLDEGQQPDILDAETIRALLEGR